MATPPSINSRTSNETRNLTNNGRITVPISPLSQTPVQQAGSVIFSFQKSALHKNDGIGLHYSDGTQWQQIIASPNGNVLCICDSSLDTTICTDTDPETDSDTIFMRTANAERVTINSIGDMIETLRSKEVTTIDDITHTSTSGDITRTTDTGNITDTTDSGNINHTSTSGDIVRTTTGVTGDITNTTDAGDISNIPGVTGVITNTTDTGNITNTSASGDINNTTSNGATITNMTTGGNITNTSTNGNINNTTDNTGTITNTTTDGNITNTSTSGDINNTTDNTAIITNATTDGNITNTSTSGDINNTTDNTGVITNTTTGGNITNTSTSGDINNTTTDGDINNTTTDGDITNTATTGTIIESSVSMQTIVQNNYDIVSTSGNITITADSGSMNESAESMDFFTFGDTILSGGEDWCANFLTGFIKADALGILLQGDNGVRVSVANGDACIETPTGTAKRTAMEITDVATGPISVWAGAGTKSLRSRATRAPGSGCIVIDAEEFVDIAAGGSAAASITGGDEGGDQTSSGGAGVSGGGTGGSQTNIGGAGGSDGGVGGSQTDSGGDGGSDGGVGGSQTSSGGDGSSDGGAGGSQTSSGGDGGSGGGGGGSQTDSGGDGGSDGGVGGSQTNIGGDGSSDGGAGGSQTSSGGTGGSAGGAGGSQTSSGGTGGSAGGAGGSQISCGGTGGPGGGAGGSSSALGGSGGPGGGAGGSVDIAGGLGTGSSPGGTTTIGGGSGDGGNGGDVNICNGSSISGTPGGVTIKTIGNNNPGITIETTGSNNGGITLCAPMTKIEGALCVTGETITLNTETLNIEDNCIYLNNGYTTTSGMGGCIVVNYLPTSNVVMVDTGGFTEGVTTVSNPTVVKTNSHTFSPGDLIQISGASDPSNNGLFEVLSDTGTLLTIRGVGTDAETVDFVQNQFKDDATVAGEIRQVDVMTIGSNSTGEFVTQEGSNTGDTSIMNPDPVVSSIVPGSGILVDNTDPSNPIVSTDGSGVLSVGGGTGISITGSATDPVVNNDGVLSASGGTGISISGTAADPVVDNDGVLSVSSGDTYIIVDNSDSQNPGILNNPFARTRCLYYFRTDAFYHVDFNLNSNGSGPVLWHPPATISEENNMEELPGTGFGGRLRMTGASISPTIVKIDWNIDGDFIPTQTSNAVQALMWIYKNDLPLQQSRRRFVAENMENVEVSLALSMGIPVIGACVIHPINYNDNRNYSEGRAAGSLITSLENGDIIDLRGGLVENSGPVTDRELYNYSIRITEL